MKTREKSLPFLSLEAIFSFFLIAVSVALLTTPYYALAVLPGLGILLLLLLGRFPQGGFYLMVFLIPFDRLTGLHDSSLGLSISKFVGLWVFIVVLFKLFLKKNENFNLKSNLWPWLAFFFSAAFISTWMSDYAATSYDNLRLLLTAYVFFFLTQTLISEKGFAMFFPSVIVWSVTIGSFLGAMDYVANMNLFVQAGETERKMGGAQDPNEFSSMIIFSLPFLAHWLFSSRHALGKKLIAPIMIIDILAVMLTYSRGGAVTLALIFIFLLKEHIQKFRPRYLGFAAFSGIVLLGTVMFLVPSSYLERIKTLSELGAETQKDRSLGGRVAFAQIGWEFFKEAPVWGMGPGAFRDRIEGADVARAFSGEGETTRRAAHNSYIELLVGQGLVGFFGFLGLTFVAIKNFSRARENFIRNGQEEMASLAGAYRLSFLSLLFTFFLLSLNYHKYFWASLALSQVVLNISREPKENDDVMNSRGCLIKTGGGIKFSGAG